MTERYIDSLKNAGDVMNCPKCEVSFPYQKLIHEMMEPNYMDR